MADTRERLRAAGLRWAELPPVADIDEPADLAHLPAGWLEGCSRAGSRSRAMKRLVLAGAGHAHALVLRDMARAPLSGVEVVVVSPEPLAPYSGMVPGWLAGLYRFDEIVIDFPALCAARPVRGGSQGEVDALDPARRRLRLDRRRPRWTTTCCR